MNNKSFGQVGRGLTILKEFSCPKQEEKNEN